MTPKQLASLFEALSAGSLDDRVDAVTAAREQLVLPRDATALGELMSKALADAHPLVRAEAAETLGQPELIAWHTPLIAALERDEDSVVRCSAAEALGDAGNTDAVPALLAALDDPVDAVRGYAASALGQLGAERAVVAIASQLSIEETASRFDMLAALVRLLDTRDAVDALLDALDRVEEADAFRALNVLEWLLKERPPASLVAEAPRLRPVLTSLVDRLGEVFRGHVGQLLARSESIRTGGKGR